MLHTFLLTEQMCAGVICAVEDVLVQPVSRSNVSSLAFNDA